MNGTKRKLKNCQGCDRNDDYDNMVCCDKCSDWYHFKCGGAGPGIINFYWWCQMCLKAVSETYQEATEDSISRNLEVLKKNVNTAKRTVHVGNANESLQTVAKHLEADDVDKIIERKVEAVIAKHIKDLELAGVATIKESVGNSGVPTNGEADLSEIILEKLDLAVDSSIATITITAKNADAENASAEVTIDESYLPVETDENISKLEEELAHNFEYFHQKYQHKGAEKISTTMRIH